VAQLWGNDGAKQPYHKVHNEGELGHDLLDRWNLTLRVIGAENDGYKREVWVGHLFVCKVFATDQVEDPVPALSVHCHVRPRGMTPVGAYKLSLGTNMPPNASVKRKYGPSSQYTCDNTLAHRTKLYSKHATPTEGLRHHGWASNSASVQLSLRLVSSTASSGVYSEEPLPFVFL
jgi:hypothetical protein